MKATKHTIKFEVEVLDKNSVAGVVVDALRIFDAETPNGEISKTDGDCIKWSTESKEVTI